MTKIERTADGFRLQVEDGASFEARRVVMAVGISHFAYVPGLLSHLPKELLTHSSAHHDCTEFRGKKVTIIGAGASAVDMAALMHESGVDVTLVARAPKNPIPRWAGKRPAFAMAAIEKSIVRAGTGMEIQNLHGCPGNVSVSSGECSAANH